ncbi:MAG: hypothetical protein NTX64_03710 [Elusimicrobia bacterium]|nr:hypothetical protein [Elusimicrobiota bacterium]
MAASVGGEKRERKACGFWTGFMRKLGLVSSAPLAPAASVSLDLAEIAGASFSLFGSPAALSVMLATVAAAVMVGTAGRGVFYSRPRSCRLAPAWALFPQRSGDTEAASQGSAGSESSSLDYANSAEKNDPSAEPSGGVYEPGAGLAAAGSAVTSPAASSSDGSVLRTDAFAAAPSASPTPRPGFQRLPSFANAARVGGLRDALAPMAAAAVAGSPLAAGSRVFGVTSAMRRDKTASAVGRRSLVGGRGARTSDMLLFANRDGLSQKRALNPTMALAGSTFDGSRGVGGSTLGEPLLGGSVGGLGDSGSRIQPDRVLDQKNVDVPTPAPVDQPKNTAPYQWAMIAAIAALGIALLLSMMAGAKKDAAKALVGPAQAAALSAAAMLHMLAAAAAALALAMGAFIMGAYGQALQGMIFVGAGGALAAYNLKSALDLSQGSQQAGAEKQKTLDGVNNKGAQIGQDLGSTKAK